MFQELASARDDLLHQLDVTHQEQEALIDFLQGIMGEQSMMGESAGQAGSQPNVLTSSLLDWEIAPDMSFDSIRSSMDPKTMSGSLDPGAFCANPDCLNARMRYEHLVERIQEFLKRNGISSNVENVEDESSEHIDESDSSKVRDMFVVNNEDSSQMLQRITSLDLELFARSPKVGEHDEKDIFVSENQETTSEIIDILVKESSKQNTEGHFDASEDDGKDDDVGQKGTFQQEDEKPKSFVYFSDQRRLSGDKLDNTESQASSMIRKRPYSMSDIDDSNQKLKINTSQSDNTEGQFVMEQNIEDDVNTSSVSDNEEENVFTEEMMHESEQNIKDKMEMMKEGTLSTEQDGFIEERLLSSDRAPGTEELNVVKVDDLKTGEESGDFFEENAKPMRPKSAEKVRPPMFKPNLSGNKDFEPMDDETEINEPPISSEITTIELESVLKNENRTAESGHHAEGEAKSTGKRSYENAVFDILNSICPGTDPSRVPAEVRDRTEMLVSENMEKEDILLELGSAGSDANLVDWRERYQQLEDEFKELNQKYDKEL